MRASSCHPGQPSACAWSTSLDQPPQCTDQSRQQEAAGAFYWEAGQSLHLPLAPFNLIIRYWCNLNFPPSKKKSNRIFLLLFKYFNTEKKIIWRIIVLLQIIFICVVLITASYSPVQNKQTATLSERWNTFGKICQLMARHFSTDAKYLG